jgi:hypothetical protein
VRRPFSGPAPISYYLITTIITTITTITTIAHLIVQQREAWSHVGEGVEEDPIRVRGRAAAVQRPRPPLSPLLPLLLLAQPSTRLWKGPRDQHMRPKGWLRPGT